MEITPKMPPFLESYTDFFQHIEELYSEFPNPSTKGREFASLVKDTLSSQDEFLELESELNDKETHDKGVDIFWYIPDNRQNIFFCQSKYKIKSVDDLDGVISKFKAFEDNIFKEPGSKQLELLSEQDSNLKKETKTKYLIVTLWKLEKIINSYNKSERPSLIFYNDLLKSERLEIIDGIKFYEYFLDSYRKEYSIPQEVRFKVSGKLICQQNVYVGFISSQDLVEIYKSSRNGIFFENVRDFIGLKDKDGINYEIYETALNSPSKMIERNNGITFKASSLDYQDSFVVLRHAGIINGCQTTICIVKADPKEECYIPVKIVIISDDQDSSDVARTANTQNRIDKINLELSDFIRPQLIKNSLSESGISISDNEEIKSAPIMAASICNQRILKSDLRFLFIGLFSKTPRNILNSDYSSIRFDELKNTFASLEIKKQLNLLLAQLIIQTSKTFDALRQKYSVDSKADSKSPEHKIGKVFSRLFSDNKGYKAYLIVLAVFCVLAIEEDKQIQKKTLKDLFIQLKEIVNHKSDELNSTLEKIFRAVVFNAVQEFSKKSKDFSSNELDNEISQYLSNYIKTTPMATYFLTYNLIGT